MIQGPRISRAAVTRCLSRNHMSHAGGLLQTASVTPGLRPPLPLGLDAARASQNILRLLEASHGTYSNARDSLDTVWHADGLTWRREDGDWTATSPTDTNSTSRAASVISTPSLLSVNLSDDRTALVKLQGSDGLQRYLSLLRLSDPLQPTKPAAHDGWQILREVVASQQRDENDFTSPIARITSTLQDYLTVEHAGGTATRQQAEQLFAPRASLLAVGTAPLDAAPNDWSAPAGSLLSIPRAVYLDGVATQTPHDKPTATKHDAIVQVDVLPCHTAASAVVHVGNGAQTTVCVDHLLLGKTSTGSWTILSKTFTPRPWPE